MKILSIFCIFFFWASFTQAQKCPSLSEIRTTISKGNEPQALLDLECLHQQSPNDVDVLRLLSDLHWWRLNTDESERYAQMIANVGGSSKTDEMGIHIRRRLSRFKAALGAQGIWNDRSTNYEITAEASARYWRKNYFSYRFLRDSRSYDSNITLSDLNHRLSHITTLNRYFYLDTAISFTQQAEFLPKWKYEIEPHLIGWKVHDFGVGFIFSDYPLENVFSIKPMWHFEIRDDLSSDLRIEFSLHPQRALNAQVAVNYQWTPRLFSKASVTYGKSYEGDELTPKFFSASLGAHFHLTSALIFRADSNLYRSDIRDEYRFGGGLEFLF